MRNKNFIALAIVAQLQMIATSSHAGAPLWTFTPLTATTISMSPNQIVDVQYLVTNQSVRTHTLMMENIPGVTQIIGGGGVCGNPFTLSSHSSCILSLQINGSQAKTGNTGGPSVCEQGNRLQCYRPSAADILSINITHVPSSTTLTTSVSDLALSVTGLIEYGANGTPSSGAARVITITNTGSNPATNLSVNFPTWPSGTSAVSNCGSTLAAGDSCTVTVTPGNTATSNGTNPCSSGNTPTPGVIQVTADNATTVSTNVVILSYGCIYQGGYVYAFDDTLSTSQSVSGKVATTTDQAAPFPSGVIWSSNGSGSSGGDVAFNAIYGISETSTTSSPNPSSGQVTGQFACNGSVHGACDTNNIYVYYQNFASGSPINLAFYAAGLCKQTISGFSDWYLPSLCEMGYGFSACGTSGTPTLQNMQSSLVDFNSLNLLSGLYWSSTEGSSVPLNDAWYEQFASGGSSNQSLFIKNNTLGVRCSRTMTP